jgi:hypothetical protein
MEDGERVEGRDNDDCVNASLYKRKAINPAKE